jgi:hypothetical protein
MAIQCAFGISGCESSSKSRGRVQVGVALASPSKEHGGSDAQARRRHDRFGQPGRTTRDARARGGPHASRGSDELATSDVYCLDRTTAAVQWPSARFLDGDDSGIDSARFDSPRTSHPYPSERPRSCARASGFNRTATARQRLGSRRSARAGRRPLSGHLWRLFDSAAVRRRAPFALSQSHAALAAGPQYRLNALTRSCAISSAGRPSICQRSSMNTTWPSLNNAICGDDGGYPVK